MIKSIKKFITNNRPVRNIRLINERLKVSDLEEYAIILEQHCGEGVIQLSDKVISDRTLSAKMIIFGDDVKVSSSNVNGMVVIKPGAKRIILEGNRFCY